MEKNNIDGNYRISKAKESIKQLENIKNFKENPTLTQILTTVKSEIPKKALKNNT